jgi:hypothetical protein
MSLSAPDVTSCIEDTLDWCGDLVVSTIRAIMASVGIGGRRRLERAADASA